MIVLDDDDDSVPELAGPGKKRALALVEDDATDHKEKRPRLYSPTWVEPAHIDHQLGPPQKTTRSSDSNTKKQLLAAKMKIKTVRKQTLDLSATITKALASVYHALDNMEIELKDIFAEEDEE